jgi:putative transcriptional regulator
MLTFFPLYGIIGSQNQNIRGKNMNRLKTLRKASGMKQKDIAAALSISRGALWYYEKGKRKLSFDMAIKLAKVYNVSVADLVDRE